MDGVWRYILVALDDSKIEIVGSKAYFSRDTCAAEARLVAQGMLLTDKRKYGFRCVQINYEPPDLDQRGEG